MSDSESGGERSRRTVIRGGLVVAGAAVATTVGARPAGAQSGDPMLLGRENQADATTGLTATGRGPALEVKALQGSGVAARSFRSAGVVGIAGGDPNDPLAAQADPNDIGTGFGVFGLSQEAAGVVGRSARSVGVLGTVVDPNEVDFLAIDPNSSFPSSGVFGLAPSAPGVQGRSIRSFGVLGTVSDPNQPFAQLDPNTIEDGAGVFGLSNRAGAAAVRARHLTAGGVGLEVVGRLMLSTAGRAVVPAGQREVRVEHKSVSTLSAILATLNTPTAAVLEHVTPEDGAFTIALSRTVRKPISVAYVIIG